MKCYVINLDRSPERMKRMTELLAAEAINFQRVPAVDGQLLSPQEIETYQKQRKQGKPMAMREIACAASHLAALRHIVDQADDYAVVMEDDLHLSGDAGHFINSTAWIPAEAELIKLETVNEPTIITIKSVDLNNGRKLVQLAYKHWGAGAYVISKSAARKVLQNYVAGLTPIDDYLFDPSVSDFSLWQMQPAIAVQDIILVDSASPQHSYLASGIEDERKIGVTLKSTKVGALPRIKREILRIINKGRRQFTSFWGIRVSRKFERTIIKFRA